MKIVALVEAADHPCYRYRIEAFAWAMAERGMYLEAVPLGRGIQRFQCLTAARRADVVVLQRKLLPLAQLLFLRRHARRLVYDFDDALFQRDSFSHKGPDSWSRTARFWATVYSSDAVIAGNAYLADAARAFAPTEQVHTLPTCIDPARYRPARHARRGATARLMWIGQASTLPSLQAAQAQLTAAAERLPGLTLRLVCDRTLDLGPLRVEPRRWSTAREAADLADGDIGVNWLPDDTWSPGKCGLRVLQFMAAGLPVVANRVGLNREMVVHGETGFLADTPHEWAEAVAQLANDPPLRQRMGTAARQLVADRYAADLWAPRFAGILAGVTGNDQGEPPASLQNNSRETARTPAAAEASSVSDS